MSLALAATLLEYAPRAIKFVKALKSKDPDKIVSTVLEVAKQVTNKTNPNEAIEALSADPTLQLEYQKLLLEKENELPRLQIQDVQNARKMYSSTDHEKSDEIIAHIMTYNLVVVFILVVINIVAVYYLKDEGNIIAIVSNFIGIVVGALLNERQQVANFLFGSSLGSKKKTDIMNQ